MLPVTDDSAEPWAKPKVVSDISSAISAELNTSFFNIYSSLLVKLKLNWKKTAIYC